MNIAHGHHNISFGEWRIKNRIQSQRSARNHLMTIVWTVNVVHIPCRELHLNTCLVHMKTHMYVCMWSLYIGMKAIKHIWYFREWNRHFQNSFRVTAKLEDTEIFHISSAPTCPTGFPAFQQPPTPEWSFCYKRHFLTHTSSPKVHGFCESSSCTFCLWMCVHPHSVLTMCVHPHSVLKRASVSLYPSYPFPPPQILQHWLESQNL